ncbi:centrosomal protein of 120 kDa-like [Anopheles ziemanni]|uniref:centrosomal protein of 120 kDa-like n=1 Tax=Anopheles coustani TaxID=139045 RepID=UPI00265AF778|nr:centrosomal protein of 120 kDa-like [Anopheles coustani]XP_058169162.1 centrosomal protein of 120 kDa-like [Anopheles ziemanni]
MERCQKNEEKCIIVLRVVDGVNFRQEKPYRKIKLSASIGTQAFETETLRPVTPSTLNAKFDALFVWESDSYSVKCMKMENLPIKVECFELLPQNKWCRIGSVIIPLRNVPRVQLSRIKAMQPHGYRLIAIENARWRRQQPELKMLAMITDPKFLKTPTEECLPAQDEDISCNDNPATQPSTTIYANPSTGQLPENVKLLEDRGVLQIGRNETNTDLFLLSIIFKCGSHLDQLNPGVDMFGLRYYLFGEVYNVHIEREQPSSAVFSVKETISINIRSSLATLSDYLQNAFKIAVDLLPKRNRLELGDVIGKSTIDLVGFLQETDLSEFKRKHANNESTLQMVKSFPIFPVDGSDQNDRASSERLIVPSLKCKFSLRFLGNDNNQEMEAENQKVEVKEHDETHERECNLVVSPEMSSTASEPTKDEQHQTVPTKTQATNSDPTLVTEEKLLSQNSEKPITPQLETPAETLEKVDIATILLNANQDLRDIRRTFAFSVQVGLIQFTTSPSAGLWQLTLQHPKADTPFTKITLELIPDAVLLDRIDFGKITLKLFFSSLPERVMEVISSEPSKLTVNGPHGIHLLARLDNSSLLVGNREQQSSGVVVMVDGSTGENVAIATVGCTLEEVGLNYNSQLAESGTIVCCHKTVDSGQSKMHPFDENVSYQLLEEQKAWMNEERERFLEELREKERNHLQTLTHDWKVQRAEEEKRLADRLAQADAMVAALEEAHCSLEDREHLDTQAERLRRQFRDQLEAIRSKAVRLEREAEAQIEATRKQCHELQEQLTALGVDHQHLLDVNLQLQRELDAERLSREEERLELLKKIDDISASKLHYKDQWAKMMRKVHQLEQDLAVNRTPYYQANKKEPRKTATNRPGGGGSQLSMISARHRGAGDSSSCSLYKPPDSYL